MGFEIHPLGDCLYERIFDCNTVLNNNGHGWKLASNLVYICAILEYKSAINQE